MAPARGFDAELAQLESLREADPATTLDPIRKALAHRNNFIVAKAAKLIATHKRTRDHDLRSTPLAALALTRRGKTINYFFDQIADGNKTAREALEDAAPSNEVLERLRTL